jgi:hypothetical protein
MANKRAQEEMIGVVLIVILVSVVLLVLLGFALRKPQVEAVESYEVGSFIHGALMYTSDCAQDYEPSYYSLRELIIACGNNEFCLDDRNTCDVLNKTLGEIADNSWNVGEQSPIKAYDLKIISGEEEMFSLIKGNFTQNSKSSMQEFVRQGEVTQIHFSVYY